MDSDTRAPALEHITVETYRDGALVETREIAVPKAPPSPAELQRRIAELEERLSQAEAPPDDVSESEVP